jgi:hypothetical protein
MGDGQGVSLHSTGTDLMIMGLSRIRDHRGARDDLGNAIIDPAHLDRGDPRLGQPAHPQQIRQISRAARRS